MTPREPGTLLEPTAGTPDPAAPSRTPASPIKWLRAAVMVALGLGTLAASGVVAYELALAKVPQHRASLERLVQSQTGLDVRFNELGLRLGWYGPEAVFRRVELGEPGRSNVLLRAPELTVGFDAWRSLQTGKLEAGRITLISPDIDLERLTRQEPSAGAAQQGPRTEPRKAKILQRWRGGRIELQGGTLRLPDPGGSANSLTIQIRRATFRRTEDRWNAFALVFLPERLGGTARIAVQLQGDLEAPSTWSGALRFDGTRLLFNGWHDVIASSNTLTRSLPVSGSGDFMLRVRFDKGRIERADGELRATDVSLDAPPWLADDPIARAPGRAMRLAHLAGTWRMARREAGWQVQVEQLALGPSRKDGTLPTLSFELSKRGAHGRMAQAPIDVVAQVARWLNPSFDAAQVALQGTAKDIEFAWDATQPVGRRLRLSTNVQRASIGSKSEDFVVEGLNARITGNERTLELDLASQNARIEFRDALETPVESLRLASRIRLQTDPEGWTLTTSKLTLESDIAHLTLSGSMTADDVSGVPVIDLRGSIAEADIEKLQKTFGPTLTRAFGANANRLVTGRIEEARFDLKSTLDAAEIGKTARVFRGSLSLRDAKLTGDDAWPEAEAIDARLQWNGPRMRIDVESAHAGVFQVSDASAQWATDDSRATRISGHATGRLESVLPWLSAREDLHEYVPHLRDVAVRGDAEFDFDVSVPVKEGSRPSVRIITALDSAQLRIVPSLPPVEGVRGTIAYERGKLQRSTISAKWLGGPVTLRVSERKERGASAVAVQAQGLLNAPQLLALTTLGNPRDVTGEAPWSGEFSFVPTARWEGRAEVNFAGVTSSLPQPLQKASGSAMTVRIEASGNADEAVLRVGAADRARTVFAMERVSNSDWRVDRGTIRLGGGAASLPEEAALRVQGKVNRLDLPAYVNVWQRVRREADAPPITAELEVDELVVAGRSYADVKLRAFTAEGVPELQVESPSVDGVIRWPGRRGNDAPVDIRFARLNVPERTESNAVTDALAVLGGSATIFVDEFAWQGRPLGRLSAKAGSRADRVHLEDVRIAGGDHDARGSVDCDDGTATCRIRFELETDDAAATLTAFGFRPDVRASQALLSANLEWSPGSESSFLEAVSGRVNLRLSDGATRIADSSPMRPFALLTVPGLLYGIARPPGSDASQPPSAPRELAFQRLEATFDLRDGQAHTSDLHFDGDAEILVHGRTGLLARDYDHTAYILRGEERIPAAVRRLGAAPRVAAAWMNLRDLLRGDSSDRTRIVLHLRGSWSDPIVTLE